MQIPVIQIRDATNLTLAKYLLGTGCPVQFADEYLSIWLQYIFHFLPSPIFIEDYYYYFLILPNNYYLLLIELNFKLILRFFGFNTNIITLQ